MLRGQRARDGRRQRPGTCRVGAEHAASSSRRTFPRGGRARPVRQTRPVTIDSSMRRLLADLAAGRRARQVGGWRSPRSPDDGAFGGTTTAPPPIRASKDSIDCRALRSAMLSAARDAVRGPVRPYPPGGLRDRSAAKCRAARMTINDGRRRARAPSPPWCPSTAFPKTSACSSRGPSRAPPAAPRSRERMGQSAHASSCHHGQSTPPPRLPAPYATPAGRWSGSRLSSRSRTSFTRTARAPTALTRASCAASRRSTSARAPSGGSRATGRTCCASSRTRARR